MEVKDKIKKYFKEKHALKEIIENKRLMKEKNINENLCNHYKFKEKDVIVSDVEDQPKVT